MYDQNDNLIETVGNLTEDNVIKTKVDKNDPTFTLLKDPKEKGRLKYYVIRTKRRTMQSAIDRYKRLHRSAKILLQINYNPNTVNLWDRIKENLGPKISVSICKLGIRGKYTEENLIDDINAINEERYNVDV